MINDATILRFHFFSADAAIQVAPRVLAQITQALEAFARDALSTQVPEAQVSLFLVASPREGCLEFFFRVKMTGAFRSAQTEHLLNKAGESKLTKAAEAAAIITCLWVIIFGGRGVLDLKLSAPSEPPLPRTSEESARFEAVQLLAQKNLETSLRSLVNAAIKSNADAVEIQLPGEVAVSILDRTNRTRPGLLARGGVRQVDGYQRIEGARRNTDNFIRVRYNGSEYPAFQATLDVASSEGVEHALAILVWASQRPLPTPGREPFAIQTQPILDPNDVIPIDPVPAEFEESQFVLLVRQSSDWK